MSAISLSESEMQKILALVADATITGSTMRDIIEALEQHPNFVLTNTTYINNALHVTIINPETFWNTEST